MSEKLKELQARLTEASPSDYPGCLALIQEINALFKATNRTSRTFMATAELTRRSERLFATSVSLAQSRGEIRVKGNSSPTTTAAAVPDRYRLSQMRPFLDYSDEEFEQGIKNARERGSLGRTVLIEELELLRPKVVEVTRPKVTGTPRGRRTVEHMAIQINAIAMGCGDVAPEEVDYEVNVEMVMQVFEDIGTIRSWLRKVKNHEAR